MFVLLAVSISKTLSSHKEVKKETRFTAFPSHTRRAESGCSWLHYWKLWSFLLFVNARMRQNFVRCLVSWQEAN